MGRCALALVVDCEAACVIEMSFDMDRVAFN